MARSSDSRAASLPLLAAGRIARFVRPPAVSDYHKTITPPVVGESEGKRIRSEKRRLPAPPPKQPPPAKARRLRNRKPRKTEPAPNRLFLHESALGETAPPRARLRRKKRLPQGTREKNSHLRTGFFGFVRFRAYSRTHTHGKEKAFIGKVGRKQGQTIEFPGLDLRIPIPEFEARKTEKTCPQVVFFLTGDTHAARGQHHEPRLRHREHGRHACMQLGSSGIGRPAPSLALPPPARYHIRSKTHADRKPRSNHAQRRANHESRRLRR